MIEKTRPTDTQSPADLLRSLLEQTSGSEPGTSIRRVRLVAIEHDIVQVDLGEQDTISTPLSEWTEESKVGTLIPGESFDVYLEALADQPGKHTVSRRKARQIETWLRLEAAFERGTIEEGLVRSEVKFGFLMDYAGGEAFLPNSLVRRDVVQRAQSSPARSIPLAIESMDALRGSVIVSHKKVQKIDAAIKVNELSVGDVLTGNVKNITAYGAFVDLGGFDGLLHLKEIGHRQLSRVPDHIKIGDPIEVEIIKIVGSRVSLSTKRFDRDPWPPFVERCPVGTEVAGVVTNVVDYGCFVEIHDGVQGLLHKSEISWSDEPLVPREIFSVGQKLTVMVSFIDLDKRRIGLSLRELSPNPWPNVLRTFPVGTAILGTVIATDPTLLVTIDGGPEAEMMVSGEMAQSANPLMPYDFLVGDRVEATVVELDSNKGAIVVRFEKRFSTG